MGYNPWGRKELDTTEVNEHTRTHEKGQGFVNPEKKAGTAALSLCLLKLYPTGKLTSLQSSSCRIHVSKKTSHSVAINNINNNSLAT